MTKRFRDRTEAGRLLAEKLKAYANRDDVLVLALPRGGVPVAFEVAKALHAPLDVFIVRKLGVPGHEELAMGAIASGGVRVINENVVNYLGIPSRVIDLVSAEEQKEFARRERLYRDNRPMPNISESQVILIDDGLATGSTMRAAIQALRQYQPTRLIVAVPIAPLATCEALAEEADEIICARKPVPFDGVGQWYEDFTQTTDNEVRELLEQAREPNTLRKKANNEH